MIVVTGLPRSGTTSVGQALENLGLKTLFFCPLTNPNGKWGNRIEKLIAGKGFHKSLRDFDAIISWRLLQIHSDINKVFNPSHVILCSRSVGWEGSMEAHNFSADQMSLQKSLLYNALYNFPDALHLDISRGIRYDQLTEFLDIESFHEGKIPHTNRGNSYQI